MSVPTLRLLRACVGPACTWNNLKAGTEFLSAEDAREGIEDLFNATAKEDDMDEGNGDQVPEQIRKLYGVAEAMSALGGMLWYLKGVSASYQIAPNDCTAVQKADLTMLRAS